MRKNVIKLNAIICSIMLLIATFPVSSLAKTVDLEPSTLQATEDVADSIATASGDADIVDEYAEGKDIYLVGEEKTLYEMPKDGDDPILTTIDDAVIGMSLPKELSLKEATIASDGSFVYLGEDEYFVLGDNRNNSIDSRWSDVGNVNREDIVGKVVLRIYPFKSFGLIK